MRRRLNPNLYGDPDKDDPPHRTSSSSSSQRPPKPPSNNHRSGEQNMNGFRFRYVNNDDSDDSADGQSPYISQRPPRPSGNVYDRYQTQRPVQPAVIHRVITEPNRTTVEETINNDDVVRHKSNKDMYKLEKKNQEHNYKIQLRDQELDSQRMYLTAQDKRRHDAMVAYNNQLKHQQAIQELLNDQRKHYIDNIEPIHKAEMEKLAFIDQTSIKRRKETAKYIADRKRKSKLQLQGLENEEQLRIRKYINKRCSNYDYDFSTANPMDHYASGPVVERSKIGILHGYQFSRIFAGVSSIEPNGNGRLVINFIDRSPSEIIKTNSNMWYQIERLTDTLHIINFGGDCYRKSNQLCPFCEIA